MYFSVYCSRGAKEKMNSALLIPNARNFRLWFLLAFQAGAINAGGFIACQRFVTHTTGFATQFALDLAKFSWKEAFGALTVPVFFLFGAMISSFFIDIPLQQGQKPKYVYPCALIFLTLAAATILGELGVFGVFGDDMIFAKDYFFLVLLCLASGLQNALLTNPKGGSVRTTHLTGVTTDLGTSLVRLLFSEQSDALHEKDKIDSFARIGIIGFFILGSIVSAFLFLKARYLGFLLPTCTALGLLKYFLFKKEFRGF